VKLVCHDQEFSQHKVFSALDEILDKEAVNTLNSRMAKGVEILESCLK
jgi:hypothetical protein